MQLNCTGFELNLREGTVKEMVKTTATEFFSNAGFLGIEITPAGVVENRSHERNIRNTQVSALTKDGHRVQVTLIPTLAGSTGSDGKVTWRIFRPRANLSPVQLRPLFTAVAHAIKESGHMPELLENAGLEQDDITPDSISRLYQTIRQGNTAMQSQAEVFARGVMGFVYAMLGRHDESGLVPDEEFDGGSYCIDDKLHTRSLLIGNVPTVRQELLKLRPEIQSSGPNEQETALAEAVILSSGKSLIETFRDACTELGQDMMEFIQASDERSQSFRNNGGSQPQATVRQQLAAPVLAEEAE